MESLERNKPTQIVFHLGAHKTATSLIQKFLNNEEGFRADNQIRYIDRTDCDALIGWGDKIEKSPFELRRRLLREWSDGSEVFPVILSLENALGRPFSPASGLYPKANGNAERLSKVGKNLPVKVIFYLRPLETFVPSYYMQSINEGGVLTFHKWFKKNIDLSKLSWKPVVENIVDHFGAENVEIRDFREIDAGNKIFLSNFFAACGLKNFTVPDYKKLHNPSLSEQGLKIALLVNPLLENWAQRKSMRKFLQANFNNNNGGVPKLLTPELREVLAGIDAMEYESLLTRR